MAGLNFQTQTIINSNLDPDSSALNGLGTDNTWLYKADIEKVDGVEKEVLRIKRDFIFVKDNVKAIRKAVGHEATLCKAVIDFSKIGAITPETGKKKYCRLDIYLGVEGAEPYIYSTPWVQKGMPFWVEFTVTEDNKDNIAKVVADMIKKNHLFLVDKDLLTVEANGAVLTLTGATEYQRFRKIEVLTFNATDDYADSVAEMTKEGATNYATAAIKETVRGKNAFGTYSQIVKDLRLPTAANYQWTHVRQVETPIVGAIYNQYIIEYCAPSVNDGLHAVGQRMESNTTHVFWVNQDIASDWETALANIDPDGGTLDATNVAPSVSDRISELEAESAE